MQGLYNHLVNFNLTPLLTASLHSLQNPFHRNFKIFSNKSAPILLF